MIVQLAPQLPFLLRAGVFMAGMAVCIAFGVAGATSILSRVAGLVLGLAFLLWAMAELASPLPGSPWAPIPAVVAVAWLMGCFVLRTLEFRFASERALVREGSSLTPTDQRNFRLTTLFALATTTAAFAVALRHWLVEAEGCTLPTGASMLLSVVMGATLAVGGLAAAWLVGRLTFLPRGHVIGLLVVSVLGFMMVEWIGGLLAHLGDSDVSWDLKAAPYMASLKGRWWVVHVASVASTGFTFAAARLAGLSWVWWPLD